MTNPRYITIVVMFCSTWTSHRISHLRLHLWCEIALRNPFSQYKSTIVYTYQSFWNSSDLGGRKSWGPPITSVLPVPMSAKIFEWCVYFLNGSRKRRSYCKYRNKFGQLGIRNHIEYVIFYLFLVNIIGNCHENKYIWIYCDA